jgi:hypothetical protein
LKAGTFKDELELIFLVRLSLEGKGICKSGFKVNAGGSNRLDGPSKVDFCISFWCAIQQN